MPLHDWAATKGFDMLHTFWLVGLQRWIRARLPEGYRAYIGSTPSLSVGAPTERPDVAVRDWMPDPPSPEDAVGGALATASRPDTQVATAELDPHPAIYVAFHSRLVAAVELISPRNKDRVDSREHYLARYLGYLREGASLLLVDVHRRPLKYSFADAIASALHIEQPHLPAPLAVGYRVDGPAAPGGRLLSIWRKPMEVGAPLPQVELPIVGDLVVPIDLEVTYSSAAAESYLD